MGIGKPAEINWGTSPTQNKDTFTYDGEGRLKKQTRLVSGQDFAYEVITYDTLDRPTEVKLYTGGTAETLTTTYDKEGANTLNAGGTALIDNVGYNERGQLVFMGRPGVAPETTLVYHAAANNFRLNKIVNGQEVSDALPDFIYSTGSYDNGGNLTAMQMKLNGSADNYSFSYDELNRLMVTSLDSMDVAANFLYTYAYDRLGNITSRTGSGGPVMTYTYGEGEAGPQAVTTITGGVNYTYAYDPRGNIDWKKNGGVMVHNYTFDVENRLTSILTNGTYTMSFAYDADGQRVKTTRADGTILYTPFPDYEVEVPTSGATTTRTTYRLAG